MQGIENSTSRFRNIDKEDKVSFCICCGKVLTEPQSVSLSIGPICRKRVAAIHGIKEEAVELQHVKEYLDALEEGEGA